MKRRDDAAGVWRKIGWLFTAAALAALVVVPASADAFEMEVGGLVGGNWNLLTQPTDPEGEPTFLWGSAFSGFGAVAGATSMWRFVDIEETTVGMTAELLYGYHRGAGWAEHSEGGRVDVLLTSHALRVPVMARVETEQLDWRPNIGLGIEPIFGVMTTATVQTTGIAEEIQPVETTPTNTAAAVLAAGATIDLGDNRTAPVDLRLSFNPLVNSSTEERFENFESMDDPGQYRVEFDWQLMATVGFRTLLFE